MASDNSRLADAISSGIVSLRAMADLRRHSNSTHPLFPHFWRLRLLPVLSFAPTHRFVGFVFGEKAINAILSVEYFCCDRPNPVLQGAPFVRWKSASVKPKYLKALIEKASIKCFFRELFKLDAQPFKKIGYDWVTEDIIYLAIIGITYYFIAKSSFSYIPGYYLSGFHSFADPGTVKAENVSQYQSAYPYDNIIYTEKECSTCKIPKPARSKHCSICNRCVARHLFLCLYGIVALGFVLAGRLKELRVVYILTVYYGIENSFRKLAPHVVQWLLGSYNTQILLMVFLAVVSLLLASFFGYHANLCRTNTTTNETVKWQDHMNWLRKVNEARASAAALKASINGMSSKRKPPDSKWKTFFRRSPLEDSGAVVKNNIYDKGILHNVWEVISPPSTRRSFLRTKSKSS
ncbi:hypothetical protein CUMW_189430 [Citrus unshiu]|uniref:S-acyltransferase n=1 Tax=Citrus unshiu TaxID=55188 RepID=A0A2H5Q296_CITUN|nr:hypothetical protein CUMW_189430 [Citrus unshiu]